MRGLLLANSALLSDTADNIHLRTISKCLERFSTLDIRFHRMQIPFLRYLWFDLYNSVAVVSRKTHLHDYAWVRGAGVSPLIKVLKLRGIPSIVDVNSAGAEEILLTGNKSVVKYIELALDERLAFKWATAIRVHNRSLRDYIVNKYGKSMPNISQRINVIPIPINPLEYPTKDDYSPNKGVLYFGTPTWDSLEVVIQAINKLGTNAPQLTIIAHRLRQDILTQLSRHNNIIIRPWMPHHLLLQELPRYDLVLVPRTPNPTTNISTPFKVVEAMACGVPVVATALNGIREYVKHLQTGYLIDELDPCAIAFAISQIISKPNFARELGLNARKYVEQHLHLVRISDRIRELVETLRLSS